MDLFDPPDNEGLRESDREVNKIIRGVTRAAFILILLVVVLTWSCVMFGN